MTLLVAISDTSAHIYTMCLYFLAKYPQYKDKLLKEIDATLYSPNLFHSRMNINNNNKNIINSNANNSNVNKTNL